MLKVANSVINASQITGVLPVANGGTGVTTSTGTGNTVLSATPTLSGDVTLSTGNLIIGTSGKGIDFSATAGTGTSELFDDYEIGTWTPTFVNLTVVSGTPTYTSTYTKVGRTVYFSVYITGGGFVTSVADTTYISNLPFTAAGNHVCNTTNGSVGTYGSGLIQTSNVFTPSFVNQTNVVITGTYAV